MIRVFTVTFSLIFLCACGTIKKWSEGQEQVLKVKTITTKIIEDVASCKSLLDEKSPRPQICGACEISFTGNSLKVTPTDGCPRYEAFGCTTSDGRVFVINNLSCIPVAEGKAQEVKEETQKGTYRVRVIGEDCIAYIRAKKNVRILYTKEYSGYFDVGVQTDKDTIRDIETMGCVRSVERE